MYISTVERAVSPRQLYQQRLQQGEAKEDSAQSAVIEALQRLYEQLLTGIEEPPSLTERLLSWGRSKPKSSPHGLYIWGGVGRGKTWLMDIFFNSIPFELKRRLHFHHFMRNIHSELAQLKGQPDPLEHVAEKLSHRTKVLCLDELYVSDIGDAMLLGQLLRGLFQHGTTLVANANILSDHLYQDGLQRVAFLPTIALIKEHMQVVELGGNTDYRLEYLESAKVYHTPLCGTSKLLQDEFDHLATSAIETDCTISVAGREIAVVAQTEEIIWFEFDTLCGGPRASADYIEIASQYHSVFLANIPIMSDEQNDQVRRFMSMIDEFYDRNVKLIISAEGSPEQLYHGDGLAFEYKRTISRLHEMRSRHYLGREHRPCD